MRGFLSTLRTWEKYATPQPFQCNGHNPFCFDLIFATGGFSAAQNLNLLLLVFPLASVPFWPVKNTVTQSPPVVSYTPNNLLRFILPRHSYLHLCLFADTATLVHLAQSRQCWLQMLQSSCAGSPGTSQGPCSASRFGLCSTMVTPWDAPLAGDTGSSDIFP